jgi:hypothetical protein
MYSQPPYLEAFSSVHKLRTRNAVVTRDPPTTAFDASFMENERIKCVKRRHFSEQNSVLK